MSSRSVAEVSQLDGHSTPRRPGRSTTVIGCPRWWMADRSVRSAWTDDAAAIAAVQARAWRLSYGAVLPAAALDEVDADAFADVWRAAITRPPSARHRVLVALEANRVVGFPVDPDALGAGHGSRLLAAAVDTLRADRFVRARIWLVVGDDAVRRFLEPAGWAADGAHRELDLTGDGTATLRQVRLHTDLQDES